MEPSRRHCFVFSPSVLSSCCSLCQAHHVCVRTPTITHVQTPWCRDIHSLFPVPPKEAEEQKRTMRYHFLNPSIFFFFVKWCCFVFFSPFLQHFWKQPPLSTFTSPVSLFFFPSFFFLIITGFYSGTVILPSIMWHNDDRHLLFKPFFPISLWSDWIWPGLAHHRESTPSLGLNLLYPHSFRNKLFTKFHFSSRCLFAHSTARLVLDRTDIVEKMYLVVKISDKTRYAIITFCPFYCP